MLQIQSTTTWAGTDPLDITTIATAELKDYQVVFWAAQECLGAACRWVFQLVLVLVLIFVFKLWLWWRHSCKWGLSVHNSIGRKNTLPAVEAPAALCVHMSILPPFRILCLYVEHFKVYYSGLPIYSNVFKSAGRSWSPRDRPGD